MIVVDASVAIKWFKQDENSQEADFYLNAHLSGRETIFIPILFMYEVANALFFSKRLDAAEVRQILDSLIHLNLIAVAPDTDLLNASVDIAETYKLSVYDASYLALAQKLNCAFVTADKKMFEKIKSLIEITLIK